MSAKFTSEFEDATDGMDLEDEVKTTDFGLVVGGGMHIGKLLIEARWTEGLIDASARPDSFEAEVKNRAFSILVGFRFR